MKERKNEKKEATQQPLSKDGLSEKETESRATDKRHNADLIKLKAFNGPFSSSAEVRVFAASDLPEEKKWIDCILRFDMQETRALVFKKILIFSVS